MALPLRRMRLADQTAAYLREGFQSGRWVGELPGVLQLSKRLVISKDIVSEALKMLEEEGWIEGCGVGRRRKVLPRPEARSVRRALRIGILLHSALKDENTTSLSNLLGIRNAIEEAGHVCFYSKKSLREMKDDLLRISHYVKSADADAWVVLGGSSVVLEWFAELSVPVLANGGRFQNLPVAGYARRIAPAIESAVDALVAHGHRRIVLLIDTFVRKPKRIPSLDAYLSFLEERGIAATDYNLPSFDNTLEGLEKCLVGLFQITPPTALMVHDVQHYAAVVSFLSRRGLRTPQDVSLICMEMDAVFAWCLPSVAHFRMPPEEYVARITSWLNAVAKGCADQRQVTVDAEYVPGGTVGPVRT